MKSNKYLMLSLLALSLLASALPIRALASNITYDITSKDVFGDIISGSIVTNGQVGPLGENASTFTNNGILQSFNLTGTGVLFGNGTNVSGTVNMNGSDTFPTNLMFYSGLGIVCALPGGGIGQCDLSSAPNFNQTIIDFSGSDPSAYAYVAFTYWNSYPSTGSPTWTVEYSDPNTLTSNQALFTSFTSTEVLPTSVPEPPTWSMMLAAFGLLLLFYRRRRSAQRSIEPTEHQTV